MQSKTSFFNTAVLRKDITRFAPVGGVYTFGLLAALLIMLANGGEAREYWPASHLMDMIYVMGLVNLGYALLAAQLLFGDLYTSRSCYALHAMPLRRESWYFTHVTAGLLYSLVPTAVFTLFALPIAASSCFVNGWQIPLTLFAAINLEYICFFGIAVFSTFCAGSRLGMLGLYGILNLGALVVYYGVVNIAEPILFGVEINMEAYETYSPFAHFMGTSLFEKQHDYWDMFTLWDRGDKSQPLVLTYRHMTENWGYFGITALVGVALMAVSLQLYRKRQLECAGDLLAFKVLEPVFTVVAALAAGVMARVSYQSFSNNGQFDYYITLAVGLVLGWFAARMLLERTTRVFRKKSFLGLGILSVAVAAAIGLVYLDPLDIEGRIPALEDIESAWFGEHQFASTPLDTPEELDQVIRLHEMALEQRIEDGAGLRIREGVNKTWEEAEPQDLRYADSFFIYYTMKDGSTIKRHYTVWMDTEAGQILENQYSMPEVALEQQSDGSFDPANYVSIQVDGRALPSEYCKPQDMESLFAALMADCHEGNMAQNRFLHTGYFHREEQKSMFEQELDAPEVSLYLSGSFDEITGRSYWLHVSIYADSRHTIQWLTDRGLLEALGISVVETDYVFSFK